MKQWRQVCRAWEEVVRCNIEIRRLHTSIIDEGRSLDKILAKSVVLGPIHGAVRTLSHEEPVLTPDCSRRSQKFVISKASLGQHLQVSDKSAVH
jgi:hypothetical protein